MFDSEQQDTKTALQPKIDMSQRKADEIDHMIGQRIKERRKELKLSQKDVAHALGVSYQQVQKYEAGTNRISAGRLFNIACLLEMRVEDFYDGAYELSGLADPNETIRGRLKDPFPQLDNPELHQAFRDLMVVVNKAQA